MKICESTQWTNHICYGLHQIEVSGDMMVLLKYPESPLVETHLLIDRTEEEAGDIFSCDLPVFTRSWKPAACWNKLTQK